MLIVIKFQNEFNYGSLTYTRTVEREGLIKRISKYITYVSPDKVKSHGIQLSEGHHHHHTRRTTNTARKMVGKPSNTFRQ